MRNSSIKQQKLLNSEFHSLNHDEVLKILIFKISGIVWELILSHHSVKISTFD